LGLAVDEAFDLALGNLHAVLEQRSIPFVQLGFDPGEFIVVAGPHWLASALVLHGGLHEFVAAQVEAQEVHVVLPERDHAVFFSQACSEVVKNAVKAIAHDKRSVARKPFGPNLFEYSAVEVKAAEGAI
jgi:hypothetical protein